MQIQTISLIIEMRSRGTIPFKVSKDVVASLTNFVNIIVDEISQGIDQEFGHSQEVRESILDLKTVLPKFGANIE